MIWALLIAIVGIIAILRNRRRLDAYRASDAPMLTDEQIRQVEERGWIDYEEPIDYEGVEDEEARFWEESSWDEPDEF